MLWNGEDFGIQLSYAEQLSPDSLGQTFVTG
jgi:dTDP-glucose pyrophosphorylase